MSPKQQGQPETRVAIGATDGYRYVGVIPPLTAEEVRTMEWAEVLEPGSAKQIEEPGPECTLISAGTSTGRAQEVASKIAYALRQTREGHVQHELEPVGLVGYNSTPFNPNTDPH